MGFARRIVVGISGSSGPIYGIRTLEALKSDGATEIHLVLSATARRTIEIETDLKVQDVERLAHYVHPDGDLTSPVASGSFRTDAMIVAPCSMRTLAEIAGASTTRLLSRAADVHLKERRRLILLIRETPLNLAHLRNMTAATECGAIILPPVPAFYHRPQTIDDIVNHSVGKALDLLGVPHELFRRWQGPC